MREIKDDETKKSEEIMYEVTSRAIPIRKVCDNCKYYLYDSSTNASDCLKVDDLTEAEFEQYFVNGAEGCPKFVDHYNPEWEKEIERMLSEQRQEECNSVFTNLYKGTKKPLHEVLSTLGIDMNYTDMEIYNAVWQVLGDLIWEE